MTTCSCTGCKNEATHYWSGHPTCNECGTPNRLKNKQSIRDKFTQNAEEFDSLLAELLMDNSKLNITVGELIKENTRLYTENQILKTKKFHHFNDEDCWIYQEGGNNNLKSLVCPVIISAEFAIEIGLDDKE